MAKLATKGNGHEAVHYWESVRDALTVCRYGLKVKRYQAHYIAIFGEVERINGFISVAGVNDLIITGSGQVARLLRAMVKAGLCVRINGVHGRFGHWVLSERGRAVHSLFIKTYNNRLTRIKAHQQKQHNK